MTEPNKTPLQGQGNCMKKHAALLPPPSWGRAGVGVVLSAARRRQAEPPRPHPNPPPPRGGELQRALPAPNAMAPRDGGKACIFAANSSYAIALPWRAL